MIIASFNLNSIRARMPILLEWLQDARPDLVCLQETKVVDSLFPSMHFKESGYEAVFRGEKAYNGVAILSRLPIEEAGFGFGDGSEETRLIRARIGGIHIVNTYVPQGVHPLSGKFRYKLDFLQSLYAFFDSAFSPDTPLVWAGDFNIAPSPEDVYAPEVFAGSVGFHPDEHAILDRFRKWGFTDLFRLHNRGRDEYTFFDYTIRNAVKRKMGWRIDHIWGTRPVADISKRAWIDLRPRLLKRPSDHAPVLVEIKI